MIHDEAEVRRAIALFADPENGCEIRGLTSGAHKTFLGTSIDELTAAVRDMPDGIGVYFVVNPVKFDLDKAASDGNILKRRWLYIDIDPVKPKEFADHPATDAEKARTQAFADRLFQHFRETCDWPAPIVVDSGNGVGMFFKCDLPNDSLTKEVYSAAVKELAKQFDGPDGTIDLKIHNASRLAKLPGTWAKKGRCSDDRPYRPCRIIYVPEQLECVTFDQIRRLVKDHQQPIPQPSTNGTASSHKKNDAKTEQKNQTREQAYGKRALDLECARVAMSLPPSSGGEGRNNTLNAAAFSLGQLVGGKVLDRSEVETRLREASRSAGLESEKEINGTIARGLDAGIKQPRIVPEQAADPEVIWPKKKEGKDKQQQPPMERTWSVLIDGEVIEEGDPTIFIGTTGKIQEERPVRTFEFYTLAGMMQANFPEPVWVIPGMLSEGSNILAGKPKMGKSMMALNLAMTVAAGGMALGNIQTTPGDVLYLSLEDRTRRLQARARKMLRGIGCEASRRLTLASEWPRQNSGGLEMIEWWINRVEKPTLVIIDVWGKFRPEGNPKAQQYTQDYEHMTPLKNMMDRHSCCSLSLLHCRKGASDDVVEDVSGTLGIAGAADGIIVLQRARNDNEAMIFITGRDVADTELSLRFDPDNLVWTNLGPAEQHVSGKLQLAILSYLRKLNGGSAFASEIASHLDEPPDSIRKVLHRLFERRLIRRVGKAWAEPGDDGAVPE
jgi:hypothetical protein